MMGNDSLSCRCASFSFAILFLAAGFPEAERGLLTAKRLDVLVLSHPVL